MIEALEHLSSGQVLALCILVGVLAWAWAHFGLEKKMAAAVATAKADFAKVEKRAEDYTDAEIVTLTTAFLARLTDTSSQLQAKTEADSEIASKAALLKRIQSASAAASVKVQ